MSKQSFDQWVTEELEKGYIQAIDKHFRKQYNIKQECSDERWEDAKKNIFLKKIMVKTKDDNPCF